MRNKENQSGLSALIMVGAMFLILYVGYKALNKIHQYRLFKEASNITMQAKNLACEFDPQKYSSYAEMLYEKNHIPSGLRYANDTFWGIDDITYQFVENKRQYFTLKISNLDNRSCTDLVTSQWLGGKNTQGFAAMRIENSGWFQIGNKLGARAYCTNHHDGHISVRFFGCEKK